MWFPCWKTHAQSKKWGRAHHPDFCLREIREQGKHFWPELSPVRQISHFSSCRLGNLLPNGMENPRRGFETCYGDGGDVLNMESACGILQWHQFTYLDSEIGMHQSLKIPSRLALIADYQTRCQTLPT